MSINISQTSGTSGTTNINVSAGLNSDNFERLTLKKVNNTYDEKYIIIIQKANYQQSGSTSGNTGKLLTFEILENGTLGWYNKGNKPVSYRINGGQWNSITNSGSTTFNVYVGDIVEWIGLNMDGYGNHYGGEYVFNKFICTTKCNVYGNIMSLLYGEAIEEPSFRSITNEFTYISLPNTSPDYYLPEQQFAFVFYGCTGIVDASNLILPAKKLPKRCYYNMFASCSSLEKAPELPATILQNQCYVEMFYRCTNLKYVKCLADSGIDGNTTYNWLEYASSTGTFTKKSGVNWPSGTDGIPTGWEIISV